MNTPQQTRQFLPLKRKWEDCCKITCDRDSPNASPRYRAKNRASFVIRTADKEFYCDSTVKTSIVNLFVPIPHLQYKLHNFSSLLQAQLTVLSCCCTRDTIWDSYTC